MSRRVRQTNRYHIVCGYQGLKASCFTPKVPKVDKDGNAIKSKFSKGDHDAFICQDVDHVYSKRAIKEGYQFKDNPNSQYVNVVQNWATSKPALDAMDPDQKRACNALKAFLRSRKTMLWYHKNGHECNVADEQSGAHFHIIVESSIGDSGNADVEPHQCYAYRKLIGELKRAGGFAKCQKIKHQNMLGMLCYLAQPPREYFGTNNDLFRMYYNQRVIIPLRKGKTIPEICGYEEGVDYGQELLDQVKVLMRQIDSEAAKATKNAFETMDDSSDDEGTLDESDNETCEEVEQGNTPMSKAIKTGPNRKKRTFDEELDGEIDLDAPSTSKKHKSDDDICNDTEPLELDVSAIKYKTPYQGKITQEHKIAFIKKLLVNKIITTFDEFYAYIQDEDDCSLYEQRIMHVFRSCMVSHAQKTFETAEKQVNVKHVLNTKDRTFRHYQCDKEPGYEYTHNNERLYLTTANCGITLFSNWCLENGKCLPRLLIDMYAVLTCLIPRKNTFVFVGDPKSGKTFWLNSILDHVPHVIGSFAKSSTFKFQDCASKLIIRQDEWKIDPGDGNIYKQICGGEPFSADIKCGASVTIGRTPIFVGTNYHPLQFCGKQDKEALADRMFIYDKLHTTNTINVFEKMGSIWINPLTWKYLFKWVHIKMSVMSNADYIEVSQMTDKELVDNLNAYLVQTVSSTIDITQVVQVLNDDGNDSE